MESIRDAIESEWSIELPSSGTGTETADTPSAGMTETPAETTETPAETTETPTETTETTETPTETPWFTQTPPQPSTPSTPDTPTPTETTPTPTPTPDGIPYKTTPEIPVYTMPRETFKSEIEREASEVIDGAICQAIALVSVMKDDRHSTASYPFEEDANGYLDGLDSEQVGLFRDLVARAKKFEDFTITNKEYGGDVVVASLDLSRALSHCAPDVSAYFTIHPTSSFSAIYGVYFDPEADANVTVKNGDVTIDRVKHDAALLDAVIRRIVKKMPEGLSTYDKYYYLASVICAKNTYSAEPDNCYSAYGALITGASVCEGYTTAFYLLCREAGLWCAYRAGLPNGEGHIWNMVKLEDGIYNVDVTWCDARTPGSKNWYAYFVKTDAQFVKDGHAAYDGVKGTGKGTANPYEA